MKELISARVPGDIAKRVKAQAESEGLSLSAFVEKVLSEAVGPSNSDASPEKPDWAIELEQRVSSLESQSGGRRGKRRKGR